jgi:exopolyphosphatase / guanosine-5'-triphosphate,3'-diphosphate pyrophosphatase
MRRVRVAIIDVGANTLRLLVAGPSGQQVAPVHVEREALRLGEEIERYGYITAPKCAQAAEIARAQTRRARRLGCERVEIVVTSPGRQAANGDEFADLLSKTAGVRVRVLSAEEEGELAWDGAVAALEDPPESVAVCDIGGGSTQISVGTLELCPAWVRSVDLGSLRLSERLLPGDPPSAKAVASARAEAAEAFAAIVPPLALLGLGTGGTARALRKVTGGGVLDGERLEKAIERLASLQHAKIAKRFGLAPQRAATLLSGSILFAEAQRRIGLPLRVASGGVREGCALALFRESATVYG